MLFDISHNVVDIKPKHNIGEKYCVNHMEGLSTTQDLLAPRKRSNPAMVKIHKIILKE